jgi:hypothetical protein
MISKMPKGLKHFLAELIAFIIYMPFVFLARFFKNCYFLKGIFIKRSLCPITIINRLQLSGMMHWTGCGTPLEKRFSRVEIENMLRGSRVTNIVFSEGTPFGIV